MKVLIVQHGMFPGSVAPIPKECARHLKRLGVDVAVATVGTRVANTGGSFEFPVHGIEATKPWQAYGPLIELARGVDIVHYFPGRGLELLPLFAKRAKTIFNHISVSVTGVECRDRLIDWGKRLQPSFADLVVCTDQPLADRLRPILRIPVELLPVGYAADLFHPCPPFHDDPDTRLLMYHGAVRPQRRLERLIEVMTRLPARYRLLIIGGGTAADEAYKEGLRTLAARLGCSDRVELTIMPQSEIRDVITRAYLPLSYVPVIDCFQDQFVLKTLEYLGCHRPVLTTATRYSQEFQRRIGSDRLLLCDDSVDDIAEKIVGSDEFVRRFHTPANLASLTRDLVPYSSAAIAEDRLLPLYRRLLESA